MSGYAGPTRFRAYISASPSPVARRRLPHILADMVASSLVSRVGQRMVFPELQSGLRLSARHGGKAGCGRRTRGRLGPEAHFRVNTFSMKNITANRKGGRSCSNPKWRAERAPEPMACDVVAGEIRAIRGQVPMLQLYILHTRDDAQY